MTQSLSQSVCPPLETVFYLKLFIPTNMIPKLLFLVCLLFKAPLCPSCLSCFSTGFKITPNPRPLCLQPGFLPRFCFRPLCHPLAMESCLFVQLLAPWLAPHWFLVFPGSLLWASASSFPFAVTTLIPAIITSSLPCYKLFVDTSALSPFDTPCYPCDSHFKTP